MLEKRCKIKEKVVSSALNFAHYRLVRRGLICPIDQYEKVHILPIV